MSLLLPRRMQILIRVFFPVPRGPIHVPILWIMPESFALTDNQGSIGIAHIPLGPQRALDIWSIKTTFRKCLTQAKFGWNPPSLTLTSGWAPASCVYSLVLGRRECGLIDT